MKVSISVVTIFLLILFIFSSLLVITRNHVGREMLVGGDLQTRQLLVYSSLSQFDSISFDPIFRDLSYRFNGNVVLAAVIKNRTHDNLYLEPFVLATTLAIPSSLWPSKYDNVQLARGGYLHVEYGIANIDYLITPPTVFYSVGGLLMVVLVMFVAGYIVHMIDTFTYNKSTLVAGIISVCAFIGLSQLEKDLAAWILSLRNVILLLIVFALAKQVEPIINHANVRKKQGKR